MNGWKDLGRSPVMRWMVFLVVAAMLLGLVLIPVSAALGGDSSPPAPDGAPSVTGLALTGQMGAEVTHLVVSKKGTSLSIFQMLQLANNTGKASGPITIPLPEGAANLQVVGGLTPEQMGQTKGGFVDKAGIPAGGRKQLALRYEIPAESAALTLRLPFTFPAALVYILTDPSAMTMPPTLNTPFEDGGSLDMGGRVLRQYVRGEVKAGETLQVNLQMVPDQDALAEAAKPAEAPAGPAPQGKGGGGAANAIVLAATVVLAAVALVLAWRRSAGRTPAPASRPASGHAAPRGGGPDEAVLLRRKNELVSRIARLDQSHARGELSEEEHQRQRQSFKQELMKVLLQLKRLQG